MEFLKILNDYGIRNKPNSNLDPRQQKIEQYKREKMLNSQMTKYESEQKEDTVDEENERNYWLQSIELYEGMITNDRQFCSY